jgi:leucyl aminopeptidase (aminopeptidase T)
MFLHDFHFFTKKILNLKYFRKNVDMGRPSKMQAATRIALVDYLGLTEDETLLIITDEPLKDIALDFFDTAKKMGCETILLEMTPRQFNGEEPPDAVAEIMKAVDVVIVPTSRSLTHTKAKREASKLGVRIATMPGITRETLIRCLAADPKKLVERTQVLFSRMRGMKEVYVETKIGTELTIPIRRRKIIQSTGVLRNIGDSGNLPSGEVYVAPIEDTVSGTVVFDGSIAGIGLLNDHVRVEIKKGMIKHISGGKEAKQFEEMLKAVGSDKAFAVGEFGMGTNDAATICGDILEDEKVLGTVHIAFGNNLAMGGHIKVPIHVDGLITKPDVYFDKKQVMKFGKLML